MPSVKVDGTWHEIDTPSVKIGGTWMEMDTGYCKIDGTWHEWYQEMHTITISHASNVGIFLQLDGEDWTPEEFSKITVPAGTVLDVTVSHGTIFLYYKDSFGEVEVEQVTTGVDASYSYTIERDISVECAGGNVIIYEYTISIN